MMRSHLIKCLKAKKFERFPSTEVCALPPAKKAKIEDQKLASTEVCALHPTKNAKIYLYCR